MTASFPTILTLPALPYGVFQRDGVWRLGVAVGEKIFDLHVAAQAGMLDEVAPDIRAVCASENLNALLACGVGVWRRLRARLIALLVSPGNVGFCADESGENSEAAFLALKNQGPESGNQDFGTTSHAKNGFCVEKNGFRTDQFGVNNELREAGLLEHAFVPRREARMGLPVAIADYVDFYSSLEHATNMGKLLRPGGEPLTPNWRSLPIGYYGRAGSCVVSGTPIARPRGQCLLPDGWTPTFAPTKRLDFELEVGFLTGNGPSGREVSVTTDTAEESIFGVMLLNDWSARDIQAWEYQPLGPFLGKSFATSLCPWVVPLEALEPFRVAGPVQDPPPLPYLAMRGAHNFSISLEVTLSSERMRREGMPAHILTKTDFGAMYWSMAQQLTHLSSNGARSRAGDVYASGTISGSDPGSYGSLAEITAMGRSPITLPTGETRGFLEDGDTVTMSGRCVREGITCFEVGSVSGTVIAE